MVTPFPAQCFSRGHPTIPIPLCRMAPGMSLARAWRREPSSPSGYSPTVDDRTLSPIHSSAIIKGCRTRRAAAITVDHASVRRALVFSAFEARSVWICTSNQHRLPVLNLRAHTNKPSPFMPAYPVGAFIWLTPSRLDPPSLP